MKDYNKLITNIYNIYNPSKLANIPLLLEKYKGNEQELYVEICNKYNIVDYKRHLINLLLISLGFILFLFLERGYFYNLSVLFYPSEVLSFGALLLKFIISIIYSISFLYLILALFRVGITDKNRNRLLFISSIVIICHILNPVVCKGELNYILDNYFIGLIYILIKYFSLVALIEVWTSLKNKKYTLFKTPGPIKNLSLIAVPFRMYNMKIILTCLFVFIAIFPLLKYLYHQFYIFTYLPGYYR